MPLAKVDKRQAILDAALLLFAERGYHGTAVPEIARQASVGAGTIYRHFDSKESLVNELFRHCKGLFWLALMRDFSPEAPVRQQFHVLWTNLIAFATEHPDAYRFLEHHHHGDYLDDESRALEERVRGTSVAFIVLAQQQQALKALDPLLLVSLVLGAFAGLMRCSTMGQLCLDRDGLEQAERCLWEAIRQ